jgi:hypothetical protein
VFALNGPASGGSQVANFSAVTVNGDVAIASGANLKLQGPSTINGNLYLDSGALWSITSGKVNGTVYRNQNLISARTDALNASAQAAAMTPTYTFTNITSNQTVIGISGTVTVINITGNINLSSQSLILSGPSDAFFVVNLAGALTLGGSGGIVTSGGVAISHVLINMTGSGQLLNTHVGNVLDGIVLGPNVGGIIHSANGALLLGASFSLSSNALVSFLGCPH